ncbi:MAG TPA: chemotaxis protein CheW [Myxococcaceae bacterium]|nr:chemotaxis protein CheW [Myxococcaceae bacterium]
MSETGYRRISRLPPEELEILRERAREQAQRQVQGSAVEKTEVLELNSRGQRFALPLAAIEGIADLVSVAAVPRAPPMVRGLVSFRGEVLIALELSSLTGAGDRGIADLRRIVTLSAGGTKIAILTEKVVSVRSVDPADFRPDRLAQVPFVVGTDEYFLSLLDPASLVAHALHSIGRGS